MNYLERTFKGRSKDEPDTRFRSGGGVLWVYVERFWIEAHGYNDISTKNALESLNELHEDLEDSVFSFNSSFFGYPTISIAGWTHNLTVFQKALAETLDWDATKDV